MFHLHEKRVFDGTKPVTWRAMMERESYDDRNKRHACQGSCTRHSELYSEGSRGLGSHLGMNRFAKVGWTHS